MCVVFWGSQIYSHKPLWFLCLTSSPNIVYIFFSFFVLYVANLFTIFIILIIHLIQIKSTGRNPWKLQSCLRSRTLSTSTSNNPSNLKQFVMTKQWFKEYQMVFCVGLHDLCTRNVQRLLKSRKTNELWLSLLSRFPKAENISSAWIRPSCTWELFGNAFKKVITVKQQFKILLKSV